MNPISLSPAQIGLQPVGDEKHGADSVLHGQLILAGCQYHVTAILVNNVDDIWVPVHRDYVAEVEALYTMSGSDLTTSTIEGKPYLLAIFAHGS